MVTQVASAHASVAELFMTAPLCDDPSAEETCEAHLKEALTID